MPMATGAPWFACAAGKIARSPGRAIQCAKPALPTLIAAPPVLAAGYSLLYLLLGGGFGGAVLIFIIAKMLKK